MAFADDFNHPLPKRETNWTLPNARGGGAAHAGSQQRRRTNDTSDIDGAAACTTAIYRARRFMHKPDLFHVADIDGAAPRALVCAPQQRRHNRPCDSSLNNRDIPHSFPEPKLFTTPRVVDPLNPVYALPVVKHRPPTPPPCKHEPLKISDIDGTRPRPKYARRNPTNPLDYSDVPYSTAGSQWELRKRKSPSMALQTADVCETRRRTHRVTNPLEPEYVLQPPRGAEGRGAVSLGPIEGSRPRERPRARTDCPLLSLRSDDIDGARPTNHIPYPKQRRHWKNTCDISDIHTKGKLVP